MLKPGINMSHYWLGFLLAGLFILIGGCFGSAVQPVEGNSIDVISTVTHTNFKNEKVALSKLVDSLKIDKRKCWLLVDKSDLTLSYMHNDSIVKQYPVVLGGNPIDDKLREGDQCTPEGEFKIRALYPHKSWSYFMWIDYPTKESWTKHKKAKSEGTIPPGSTIGGEVGIHGVPVGNNRLIDEKIHWTLGCVSLKTESITEIYKHSFAGMKVLITP